MRQRNALLVVLVLVATAAAEPSLDECPIRFAILGDRTGGHVPGIHGQIVAEIERLKPEFVITVGDMIEGYSNDTAVYLRGWEEYKDIVSQLSMPIYYTPGNHDITNESGLEPYRRNAGEPVYSFNHRGLHIVVLDNSRLDRADDWPQEQLDWLKNDLTENAGAFHTMVFFHKPFWYNTLFRGEVDPVHDICKAHGVDAVVCGHFHHYFTGTFDGIDYTTIGSSGGSIWSDTSHIGFQYAWVTVTDSEIHMTPMRMGSAMEWDNTTVAEYSFMSRVRTSGISVEEPLMLSENLTTLTNAVEVAIHNLSETAPLDDTVWWDIPDGWTVEPEFAAVKADPGGTAIVGFTAHCQGELYPVPAANARIPYAAGKPYVAARPLRVARRALAAEADVAPSIDGKLDESIWSNPQTVLFDENGRPAQTDSTEFYFAFDDRSVYMAAVCFDAHMDSIRADVQSRDGSVYGEDCVGYFLQPDPGVKTLYQIYTNPVGTIFDQKITQTPDAYFSGDQAWNGEYEIATKFADDRWTVEMRIPLSQLEASSLRDGEFGLAFRRKQPRVGNGDWQFRSGYDPDYFGRLVAKK